MFYKAIALLIFSCYWSIIFSQNWSALGEQIDLNPSGSIVNCLFNDGDSALYIGGFFIQSEEGAILSKIAKWDGENLLPMGCGFNWDCVDLESLNAYNGGVTTIVRYQNELYVGGLFDNSGSQALNNVARWTGSEFVPVGDGFDLWINRLLVIEDSLYACGAFTHSGNTPVNGLAKWNGTSWEPVFNFPQFSASSANEVACIAKYNDQLYVVGNFANLDLNIRDGVVWNGESWGSFGGSFFGGLMSISDLAQYNGELILVGSVSQEENINNPGNGILGWDGENWNSFNNGVDDPNTDYIGAVFDVEVHEDRVYVAGNFTAAGGIPANQLAFWEQDHWCTFIDTVQIVGTQTSINRLTFFKDTLHIAGFFDGISGNTSIHGIAKYLGGDECEITRVNTLNSLDAPSLFPNPASNQIHLKNVQSSPQLEISIYDCIGHLVLRVGNSTVVDVSALSTGMYYMRVSDENRVSVQSFIKN
jgi:trimeric autotransporter adhesin